VNFGRWSLGLAITTAAMVLLAGVVTASVLTGHLALVPPRNPTGPGRLAAYLPIELLVSRVIIAFGGAALVLGVLGIRRERSASSWIGAFGGLILAWPTVTLLTGLGLSRLGVAPGHVAALWFAAPTVVPLLITVTVGRWVWRAVRQGRRQG
jgi:hypothetical protein